ncbi:MAG: hypothetical protein Q7R79_02570, partial [bacterium]|nr:hypothetical protein [bacterium]
MNSILKNIIVFVLTVALIGFAFSFASKVSSQKTERVTIEALVNQINEESVESIGVKGDTLMIELKNGTKELVQKEPSESL